MQIKAGYRIEVTSWENDYDNLRTVAIDGLTKEQAALRYDLAMMSELGKFSNMDSRRSRSGLDIDVALKALSQKHGGAGTMDDVDYLEDIVSDLGLTSEFFSRRVTEAVRVQYVTEPVNLPDVTAEFGA